MVDQPGLLHFASLWKKAGPALQEVQDQELRECNVQAEQLSLAPLFDLAIAENTLSTTSGLVEWQQCMKLWYEKTSPR